ncbi:peptidoglycan D,D-transpeptidase FtsI family protein [Aneurinibacillus tyrosinisolvens]|uniref:peptidoglycan D,D-transpeptidase FtsI family protein n=1 Tax=Aneurinibacillus tyrosinisolvens TaxID=1443435 RepID=UPI00063FA651|nr:penicillin-binding protein 2 [Aneurinibacillus tyrosinisolvens]
MPEKRKKRRMLVVLLLFTLIYTGIVTRMAWIQVIATRSFSSHHIDLVEKSIAQRREKIVLNTGRGMIYDRNGVSLTGEEQTGLAIFPLVRYSLRENEKMNRLAQALGVSTGEIVNALSQAKHAGFWKNKDGEIIPLTEKQAKDVQALNLAGVLPLPVTVRYPGSGIAHHLIGYLGQNTKEIEQKYQEELLTGALHATSKIGAAGLERSFQPFLVGVGEKSVSYFVDGKGNPLNGLDIRLQEPQNAFYPLSISTTIDSGIQKQMETLFDESTVKKGAAVVLDVKTRDVLGMVSRPDFDPTSPDPLSDSSKNRAIKQTFPGSVFKIVVAAAAIQEGLVKPDEHFMCKGEYGKYGFSCPKKGGHGDITFADAFAESCNITFAEVAKRVGAEKLQQYAVDLGLDQQIGWEKNPFFKMGTFRQLDGEDSGRVFANDIPRNDEGILIQTGIGQRDVQMTPLQAAGIAATIADNGKKQKVRIVDAIDYQNGTSFYQFEDRPLEGREITAQTAKTLQHLMEGVVDHGTGIGIKGLPWSIAGKSGTAQTIVGGEQKNNQWFVGYTPRENPRYAIAIVAEEQPTTGKNHATEMFGKLVSGLAKDEKTRKQ